MSAETGDLVRERLPYHTIGDAVKLIKDSKNILVVAGAGISTSCGIPDFRSPNGLYSQLAKEGIDDPQSIFDIKMFNKNPEFFFKHRNFMKPINVHPSWMHYFLAKLEKENKLLRLYTQNIDNLERTAGITKLIQCHGSIGSSTCTKCHFKQLLSEAPELPPGAVPYCTHCPDQTNRGIMKPDVVFFGEALPTEFLDGIDDDTAEADLLIVVGTSLQVYPVAGIPEAVPNHIPRILINMEIPHYTPNTFDVILLGESDHIAITLASFLHWDLDPSRPPISLNLVLKFTEPNISQLINKQSTPQTPQTEPTEPKESPDTVPSVEQKKDVKSEKIKDKDDKKEPETKKENEGKTNNTGDEQKTTHPQPTAENVSTVETQLTEQLKDFHIAPQ